MLRTPFAVGLIGVTDSLRKLGNYLNIVFIAYCRGNAVYIGAASGFLRFFIKLVILYKSLLIFGIVKSRFEQLFKFCLLSKTVMCVSKRIQ